MTRTCREENGRQVPLARCLSCGREFDGSTGEYYRFFSRELSQGKDSTLITTGMTFSLDKKEYTVIGRIILIDEHDSMQHNVFRCHARGTDGNYVVVVEEEGMIRCEIPADPASLPVVKDDLVIFSGKTFHEKNAANFRVIGVEGDVPVHHEIGDAVCCRSFSSGRKSIVCEESGENRSLFFARSMTGREVAEGFPLPELKRKYALRDSFRRAFMARMLVYILFAVCAAGITCARYGDRMDVRGIMKETHDVTSQDGSTAGILYGPFNVEEGPGLYTVSVAGQIRGDDRRYSLYLIRYDRLVEKFGTVDAGRLGEFLPDIKMYPDPVESYGMCGVLDEHPRQGVLTRMCTGMIPGNQSFVLGDTGRYLLYLAPAKEATAAGVVPVVTMTRIRGYVYFAITIPFFILFVIMTMCRYLYIVYFKHEFRNVRVAGAIAGSLVISILLLSAALALTSSYSGYNRAGKHYIEKERDSRGAIRPNGDFS